jgi:hypothetical protein
MEIVLRGGALLATPTVGIKYGEEKCDGCTIVVYRFNEQRDAEFDPLGFRFNYTPSFVRVGKHFVVASNVELARELVRTLKEEDKTGGKGATASSRYRVYPGGVIGELKRTEDQILAATVLSQAVPPDEARQQFSDLVALVNYFEGLTFSTTYGPTWFAHDIRLTFKK